MNNLDMELYRIVSLEGFLSLIYNKSERFVRPMDVWDDTYEGHMLHLLDDEAGEKQLLNRLYEVILHRHISDAIRNYVKLLHARYLCYGQCWSTQKDSDAMWRIYSYGDKAIQLVTTASQLQDCITQNSDWDGKRPRIEKVQYDASESLDDNLGYFVQGMYVDEPYFHKRSEFMHETEVRVILNDKNRYGAIPSLWCDMLETNFAFEEKENPKLPFEDKVLRAAQKLRDKDGKLTHLKKAPTELFLKIHDLCNYISGIRVHPMAEGWYVDLIRTICNQHKIRFLGQSELYKAIR